VGALKTGRKGSSPHHNMDAYIKGSNHVVLTKKDLVLVYCLMKGIKVNWIYVFKE